MGKVLIIGCGGVASVAIHKCCQNSAVFEEICIASRTKAKCDALKEKLEPTTKTKITTAEVDANDVQALIALIESVSPDVVLNLALPYQDLTIMDACLATKTHYVDTANFEPEDTAKFEYKWQWAYRERFEKAGITALLGSGFDPGVTGVFSAYALKHYFDEIHYIAITATPLRRTSIQRLTSGKCPPRAAIGRTATGSRQSPWKSSVYIIFRKLVRRICICSTMRNWNRWPSIFRASSAFAFL